GAGRVRLRLAQRALVPAPVVDVVLQEDLIVVMISWSAVVGGVSMLAMIPARGPVLVGLAWMGQFAGAGAMIVAIATVRQRLVPDHLLGRVLGTARMIAFSSIPLAALAAGLFESAVRNAYAVMAFAGLSWLAVAGAVTRSPLRNMEALRDGEALRDVEALRDGSEGRWARPEESPPPDQG
ncbi:hypothetical protein ABZ297_40750, partial [Nonomuraea sp. NPDC005983]